MTVYPDELVAAVTRDVVRELITGGHFAYNPDQEREANGQWAPGGGSSSQTGAGSGFVSKEQFAQTEAQRDAKIEACPRPSQEQIDKNLQMIRDSKRPGGDFRGSSYQRRTNTGKLLTEFGNGDHCPCVWCGRELEASTLTQDKIYTGAEGGRYTYANLLPSCLGCNQGRGDTSVTADLANALSASAAPPVKAGQIISAVPQGWALAQAENSETEQDVAVPTLVGHPELVVGRLSIHHVVAPVAGIDYKKYIVGGVDVDPGTIAEPDAPPPGNLNALLDRERARTASGAPPPDRTQSRKLVDIDRQLRARLHTAANAAMKRALERAGAKMVSKARTASGAPVRSLIEGVPGYLIPRTVPTALKASLGLDDHIALETAWDDFGRQFNDWVRESQRSAACTAAKIVGKDCAQAQQQLANAHGVAREQAWRQLQRQLNDQANALLNTDDGTVDTNPDHLVPLGFLRTSLALAGGIAATSAGIGRSGRPVVAGEVMGQIGTGGIVTTYLQANGASIVEYEWVHGVSDQPFPPHEALDGVIFENFDDPALAVDGGFPDTGFEHPGDHEGCSCDFVQHWAGTADAGAA